MQKTPKRIDVSSSNNLQIKLVLKQLDDLGYDVHLFDITLETDIPAVWVLAVNRKDGVNLKYYNAAGAHYNPEKAIFSGLVEVATSALIYEKNLIRRNPI
ncbi:YcaO-like family protein [Bacillus velezensis]|nr:YcaO-like family protein [Bacillus velezensis]QXW53627.1 YcaO-like family protein [Bacillus velezensis]